MKLGLLLASITTALTPTSASADTYVVRFEKGATNIRLEVTHPAGSCYYGDRPMKLGDTIVVDDHVMVCASASHGPVFYMLSKIDAKRVSDPVSKNR